MAFLLDRLGVAELDETSYERAEGIMRNYLKPTFGTLKAGKLTAEILELFCARLRQCQEQWEGHPQRQDRPDDRAEARLPSARCEQHPQDLFHPAAGTQPPPPRRAAAVLGRSDQGTGGTAADA
ncbi:MULTISPECIES: hypothetical protein [unclassified Streptomyces]|uniref:hypothetical protein n=1 Tax=unclassified Streptomyces TaxID=2593676 RepID=UPI0023651232|nr:MULTISPECIES: hypothetical protein [unclassified Streptomyces]MDF3145323.1 hypothetical protein [Streptomyces sp. T21Q-yed]WDF38939.1 hypothetical protein PBV52_20105 [Streptomyces sp. T12]